MIPLIGTKVAAAAVVLAFGGAGAMSAGASHAPFTATYTCSVPVVGTETVTVDAALTASPNPAANGSPVGFDLHVTSLSLTSPLAINSWSATAAVAGSGAESSQFQLTGSGGAIPSGQPITNIDLTGSWTPATAGTDQFQIGDFTINANVVLLGNISVACTPSGTQPVAGSLTVN